MITTTISQFEQCYVSWPDIVKYGPELEKRDVCNLSQTSKLWQIALLENAKLLARSDILPFIAFLRSNKITNPQIEDLSCIKRCMTSFEVSFAKIEKIVEISLVLHQLNDVSKTILKEAFKKLNVAPIISRMMKSVRTDEEIIKKIRKKKPTIHIVYDQEKSEKNYRQEFIHYLIVTGQFEKARLQIKKDGYKFNINDLAKDKNYTLVHAPFLILSERVKIIKNIFETHVFSNFNKKNIKITLQNLAKRIHMADGTFPFAFLYYFAKLVVVRGREDSQTSVLNTTILDKSSLEALGISKYQTTAIYEEAKDIFLLNKIENNLKSNDFKTVHEDIQNLCKLGNQEKAKTSLLKKQIDRHLLDHDLKNAFELLAKLPHFDSNRNSISVSIARQALLDNQIDFALKATHLINISHLWAKDDKNPAIQMTLEKDSLLLEIAMRQKFAAGRKTFEHLSLKKKHLTPFCLNAAEIIELIDIPKALDLIVYLKDKEICLKILNRIVERLFEGAFAHKWFHYANQILDDSKRRYILDLLFAGLQEKQLSVLFYEKNDFYLNQMIMLETSDFKNCLDALFILPTRWEQNLVLYRMIDYFYPNKNLNEWFKGVGKIEDDLERRNFLNHFISMIKLIIGRSFKNKLLEIINADASLAFDIVNAHPIKEKRIKLLVFIAKKINLNEDGIKWMELCDKIPDPIERRAFIRSKTGK